MKHCCRLLMNCVVIFNEHILNQLEKSTTTQLAALTAMSNVLSIVNKQLHLKVRMKKIKCEKCGGYFRKDNLIRHFNETHLKILPQCNWCDKKMTSTSLSRHKRYCHSRPAESEQSNSLDNNKDESPHLVSSISHKIEANVRVDTFSDGRMEIVSNEIKLNGMSFILVQKSMGEIACLCIASKTIE